MRLTRTQRMLATAKKALHRIARDECGYIAAKCIAQGALAEIAKMKAEGKGVR